MCKLFSLRANVPAAIWRHSECNIGAHQFVSHLPTTLTLFYRRMRWYASRAPTHAFQIAVRGPFPEDRRARTARGRGGARAAGPHTRAPVEKNALRSLLPRSPSPVPRPLYEPPYRFVFIILDDEIYITCVCVCVLICLSERVFASDSSRGDLTHVIARYNGRRYGSTSDNVSAIRVHREVSRESRSFLEDLLFNTKSLYAAVRVYLHARRTRTRHSYFYLCSGGVSCALARMSVCACVHSTTETDSETDDLPRKFGVVGAPGETRSGQRSRVPPASPLVLISAPSFEPHHRDFGLRNRPVLTRAASRVRLSVTSRVTGYKYCKNPLLVPGPFLASRFLSFFPSRAGFVQIFFFVRFCPASFSSSLFSRRGSGSASTSSSSDLLPDCPTTNTGLFSPVFYLVKGRQAGRQAGRRPVRNKKKRKKKDGARKARGKAWKAGIDGSRTRGRKTAGRDWFFFFFYGDTSHGKRQNIRLENEYAL